MEERDCRVCENKFEAKRFYSKGKPFYSAFCSPECREKGKYQDVTCETCSKPFKRKMLSLKKGNFCSVACTPRHPCPFCGTIITGRAKNRCVRRFCSRRCSIAYKSTRNSKRNYVVLGFVATYDRIGRIACERCGAGNPFLLQVHHVDRSHENHTPENLETLCANCHAVEHCKDRGKGHRIQDLRNAEFIVANRAPNT